MNVFNQLKKRKNYKFSFQCILKILIFNIDRYMVLTPPSRMAKTIILVLFVGTLLKLSANETKVRRVKLAQMTLEWHGVTSS